MLKKLVYIDTETTGTSPEAHSIVQIAAIFEVDGKEVGTFESKVRPLPNRLFDEGALKVHGYTREEMATFPEPSEVLNRLTIAFGRHIILSDRSDVFTPVGYRVTFDVSFLIDWMATITGNKFAFWKMMTPYAVDALAFILHLRAIGRVAWPKYRLTDVCRHLGIPLEEAHDAMADVRATRALARRVLERLDRTWDL